MTTPGLPATPPPGPAFAIWALLFPAVLAYVVYQAAPRRAADPLLRTTGWLTVAFGVNLVAAVTATDVLPGATVASTRSVKAPRRALS